jgi:hypothetical protein
LIHRLIESDQINSLSTIRHAKLSFSVTDGPISKRFIVRHITAVRRSHLKAKRSTIAQEAILLPQWRPTRDVADGIGIPFEK